ncbi:hypothetical protein B0H63DRAFT_29906 [Podospora didyma]|uniref:Signal transduction histidine-protein kinase n=1 Tax=Podospora didyma TaxID=330526 RepID=A0AAE0U7N9_9PEZI|nr:hypothetical protein B0H63DRAFT_29906 [Podospora didyma]
MTKDKAEPSTSPPPPLPPSPRCAPAQGAQSPAVPAPAASRRPPSPGSPGPLANSVCRRRRGLSNTDQSTVEKAEQPGGGQAPEAVRYGLTSPATDHDPLAVARPRTGIPESPAEATAGTGTGTPRVSPGALGKRSSEPEKRATRKHESPSKKPRRLAPGSLSLPSPPHTVGKTTPGEPPLTSPLFFSSSAKRMPARPPSFTASEVSASIMSGGQEPHDGVTTLRLPKGQISAASPSRSTGTPGSLSSAEFSGFSRSPDAWPQTSSAQLLHGIGAAELLEQDERPTFAIDLTDASNHSSGPLAIIFANASLRTRRVLLEQLQQTDTTDPDHDPEFAQFKAWVVSLARDKGGPDIGSPSQSYGGITWRCSTVRRRFRFVSGAANALSTNSPKMLSPMAEEAVAGSERPARSPSAGPKLALLKEQGDYFGVVEQGSLSPVSHGRARSEPRGKPEATAGTMFLPSSDLVLGASTLPQLHTTFDWTRIPLDDPALGTHHRFARSVDWASTPLGPVEVWPAELRIMSNMIMGSPHPAAMYWGQEFVAIYNEAYIALAGAKHPGLMGARYQDAWSEIWGEIQPVFDAAWYNGDATMKHDDGLFLSRHGFLEETFFNWAIIPLVGSDGSVVALYNPAFENTRRKVNERRMLTLREVGVKTSQARDVKGFWRQVQKGLEYNEYDVPFALIYSVADESDKSSMNSGSSSNPPQIVLEGTLGVPDGHPVAVSSIDLRRYSDEGFAPYMRESMAKTDCPIILSEEDGTLPSHLLEGLSWRGFGDPCRAIVVFPVHPTTAGDAVVGFIVLGVNPRRKYDEDYKLFVTLLDRQLATSMASVVLFEEEIKRGQRAARLAALDRQELSMQLHLRTQEAVESEYRFTRMAEFCPVGLFIADGLGHINYCNDMWWKIAGEKGTSTLDVWMQSIRDEDRPAVEKVWRSLVQERQAVTHEFRFKGSRQIIDGHSVDTWALMSAYPEKDEYGGLKSIFGCITDISQQKWAEDFQKQRRDEAVEMKRQQENFIDITSHEMRNPLSAILQCADEISSSLSKHKAGDALSEASGLNIMAMIDSCVEAANTISLCANHQKRIVDDILTLSKLDSKLLLVTPVDAQPASVVQNVLRMFEAELNSNEITGSFCIEQSYRDLAVDWVRLDPSRLRQVLINLMTNAIKFTQGRPTRSIVISLGASKGGAREGLSYIPPRHPEKGDITDEAGWARGEKISLHLAVTDTGPGLDDDEKKILFRRFSQASPRTHVQYGGSGLGLFICRILTELQGGQIGVQSEKGKGSTFAFYIKCRKSENSELGSSATAPTPRPSSIGHPSSLSAQPEALPHPTKPAPSTKKAVPAQLPPAPKEPNAARPLDILIVEDNLVNQRVLQRQLTLSGNNAIVANHGGEALEVLKRSRFWSENAAAQGNLAGFASMSLEVATSPAVADDEKQSKTNISVILMDLEMPVMDGMTCTKEIRRLENEGVITHHVPIIAVTAYARPEQIESAKAAGVDDVISKPFRIPELIPKIEELMKRHNTL